MSRSSSTTLVLWCFLGVVWSLTAASVAASGQHRVHLRTGLLHLTDLSLKPYSFQQQLVSDIHAQGGVISSVIPPHTWVVAVSLRTAEWLAHQPDTALAPYPPFLKLAPEWVSVLKDMRMEQLAAEVHAAMQHDSLLVCGEQPTHEREFDAWLQCRAAAAAAAQTRRLDISNTSAVLQQVPTQRRQRSPKAQLHDPNTHTRKGQAAASSTAQQQERPMPKFLIEVSFPALMKSDLERLGLTRVPPHSDPNQHVINPAVDMPVSAGTDDSSTSGTRQQRQWQRQQRYGNGTFLPAVAASQEWHHLLQRVAVQCGADMVLEHGTLFVAACAEDLLPVLQWLAAQPTVRWLSPRVQHHTQNLGAASIVQSGGTISVTDLADSSLRPFWGAGLDGTGQVIGCGDSGIDLDNCYFFDQANLVTKGSFSTNANGDLVYDQPNHRKVIFYYAMFGNVVDLGGHGTHVSGTLAGAVWGVNSLSSPSRATGQAPGAKLAFLSLSSANDRPGTTLVRTPGDLNQEYYPLTYAKGARIHSDSWGNNNTGYDNMCASADQFAYENQDFLPVFAAGNYGDEVGASATVSTITSPSLAKNVMAVGATLNFDSNENPPDPAPALTMTISINTDGKPMVITALMVRSSLGGSWDSLLGTAWPLVGAYSSSGTADACTQLSNTVAVAGKVVVAVRSRACDNGVKLNNVANAGAKALILTNNLMEGYFTLAPASTDTSGLPPTGSVPLGVGRFLWDAANSPLGGTVTFATRPTGWPKYDVLADFSSFGPTSDNRIKPDIVAPGILQSAYSDFALTGTTQCSQTTAARQGTSMATPALAGNAALVRQYFQSGFYPTGSQSMTNPRFAPSAPLVRAVLMAGAAALQGIVETGNPTAGGMPMERPSVRQGWGRADLSGSLPLVGSKADKGWSLQVVDQAKIAQGTTHRYCVSASGGPLRVMMVYHDIPGDTSASQALVNNLDLQVKAEGLGNKLLLGNVYGTNYLNPENKQQVGDSVNNVESVFLDSVPAGLVVINVVGVSISAKPGTQTYSLVVLGQFSGTLASASNPAYSASTPNLCPDINALIDPTLSPPLPNSLSSSRDTIFHLTTTTGQAPETGKGFECQLLKMNKTGGVTLPPLQDWTPCTSPTTFSGLADGTYTFRVRITGSNYPDSRTWRIDATPPVTSLTSTLPASATNASVPTAIQSATFNITVRDDSAANITCLLVLNNPAGNGQPLTAPYLKTVSPDAPPLTVCTSASCPGSPCNPPVSLLGLSYGDWSFTARAQDQAGNVDQAGATLSWRVRYTAGVTYTRLSSAPDTPRRDRQVVLNLMAFTGDAVGNAAPLATAPAAYEYLIFNTSVAPASATWTTASSATATVTLPSDGAWTIQARVAGNPSPGQDSYALANVVLDTTPPVMKILDQPNSMVGLKDGGQYLATVKYATTVQDETVTFQCRWINSTTGPVPQNTTEDAGGLTAFSTANCAGPQVGVSTLTVAGGYWLFQVRANDTVGNLGLPASVQFLVDDAAPVVSNLQYTPYTQTRGVNISFSAADAGLSGLATSNISCTMSAVYLVPTPSSRLGPAPGAPYTAVSGITETPCRNPSQYALQEGRYQWKLTVPDNAGLTTIVTANIVLDLQPPLAKVTNSLTSQPFPKNHVVQFDAVDQPTAGGASGINATFCTLVFRTASIAGTLTPPSNLPPRPPQPPSPPPVPSYPPPARNATQRGRRLTTTTLQHSTSAASRHLTQTDLTAPGAVLAQSNGVNVLNGVQFACISPLQLQNLATGTYDFQVFAVDNAGNDGRPNGVGNYSFLIDSTLPDDGGTSSPIGGSQGGSGGFPGNKLAIALTIGLSALLVAGIVGAVCLVRSRRARKREALYLQQQQQGVPNVNYSTMWYGYPPPAAGQTGQANYQLAQRNMEEERVRMAIQASLEEENMRKALTLSQQDSYARMEQERLEAAIKASLQQR